MVKKVDDNGVAYDYYGILKEILELDFTGEPIKTVVLFLCEWYDPTPNIGTRTECGIIEIKHRGRYCIYDPFIIAQQA